MKCSMNEVCSCANLVAGASHDVQIPLDGMVERTRIFFYLMQLLPGYFHLVEGQCDGSRVTDTFNPGLQAHFFPKTLNFRFVQLLPNAEMYISPFIDDNTSRIVIKEIIV